MRSSIYQRYQLSLIILQGFNKKLSTLGFENEPEEILVQLADQMDGMYHGMRVDMAACRMMEQPIPLEAMQCINLVDMLMSRVASELLYRYPEKYDQMGYMPVFEDLMEWCEAQQPNSGITENDS